MAIKKEQLEKILELNKEYHDELYNKLRAIKRVVSGKSKTKDKVPAEEISEALILISILLSGNIKARYELEEFVKDNKAFMSLNTIKSISMNCSKDLDALKSESYALVEVLKTYRLKEDEEKYKERTL